MHQVLFMRVMRGTFVPCSKDWVISVNKGQKRLIAGRLWNGGFILSINMYVHNTISLKDNEYLLTG